MVRNLLSWGAILNVAVWSLISGRAANFKHRVTLLVFFRQDWCGDLPPAEEKKCLEDSSGLLSLLEMLLKQHEARLVFVVVHKVMPWQSPEMKCLVSDALKRKKSTWNKIKLVFLKEHADNMFCFFFFINVDDSYIAWCLCVCNCN